ncbi:MAG: penicillin-binding protein 2 [Fimbriimonadaceae bacterium]|nr:penicillin-binding protein 2 [Fimbriimonadaceae bacterium]
MAKQGGAVRQTFWAVCMGLLLCAAGLSQVAAQDGGTEPDPPAPAPKPVGLQPVRTRIASSDGALLAFSQDAFEFGINYEKVPCSPAFFTDLAAAVGKPVSEIEPRGRLSRHWREPISVEAGTRARAVQKRWKADGVSLREITVREYPLGEAASGLVGDVRNGVPANGLERSLALDAADGAKLREIVLTIDSKIQLAAMSAIRRAVESNKAKQGAAVVIDPASGNLLAIAAWPTFEPGEPGKGTDLNAATMLAFEPGSTFKIITTALALNEGVIRAGSTVSCPGSVVVGKHTIHCSHGAHGLISASDVIARSCNVAAARWGMQIGHDRMRESIERLGLLDPPGLGLPGERAGSVDDRETATRLQAANWGFGQAMTCNPVALAASYAGLANGGAIARPRLVATVNGVDEPLLPPRPIFSEETAGTMLDFMEQAIESDHGTGKRLRVRGYRLGGKTGTAQKLGAQKGKYVSNFVGFVPAHDTRAVVLVMVDSPTNGLYYGADVAGPVFHELAEVLIQRLRIPSSPHDGR